MYYNPTTGEKRSRYDLKEMLNASIPVDAKQVGDDWYDLAYDHIEPNETMNIVEDEIKLIDGQWTQTYKYEAKSNEELQRIAKDERNAAVARLTVEYNGVRYDADEKSQDRLARYISSSYDGAEPIKWVDAENQVQELTIDDLQKILALAVEKTAELWVKPYTKDLGW